MPYLAKVNNEIIDSLSLDFEQFEELRYQEIFCPGCKNRMFIKYSKYRVPYFAHYSAKDYACPIVARGMTKEHLAIQALVRKAILYNGKWDAVLEYQSEGWRGDVVAINKTDGRKISFEIQISPMNRAAMQKRTDKHKGSGVESVIWLLGRDFSWSPKAASAHFRCDPSWNPQTGIDVRYQVLQDISAPYSEDKDYKTQNLSEFVYAILEGLIVPMFENNIAINRGGKLDFWRGEKGLSFGLNDYGEDGGGWIFQTRKQAEGKINQLAVKQLEEEWERGQAAFHEEQQRKYDQYQKNQNDLKKRKAIVKSALLKLIPNISFDDEQYQSTAQGDVAICPGGNIIVIEPIVKKVSPYTTTGLVADNRITILYLDDANKAKLRYKFPLRKNIYSLADLVDSPETITRIMASHSRYTRPISSFEQFSLY